MSRAQLTSPRQVVVLRGRHRLHVVAFLACGALLTGCRDALQRLSGGAPAAQRGHAEQLFAAIGARVTDPLREPKYDSARIKIARGALLPSRVWDDTAVWTGASQSRRTLLIGGRLASGRYRLEAARSVAIPTSAAESRHGINLTRLAQDEYAWDTDVAYSVGTITAHDVGAFVGALFASGEGRRERDVRSDYRAVIPRGSAALGQLFTVDSIRTVQTADHATQATFAVTMKPEGVEQQYPNFAHYLRRYIGTTRMHWTLTDRGGAPYLDLAMADGRIMLRVRTLNGVMVPLSGPARPLPDSLLLRGDFALKVRHFTVGLRRFQGDFVVTRTDHERAWSIISRREPEWTLPLIAERLLKTPLRRPFQGSGALFRIGVRDSVGTQTILHRRMHLEVQESAVLRFIGKLGAIAVSDFTGKAEREQYAWLREFFAALVADIHAMP